LVAFALEALVSFLRFEDGDCDQAEDGSDKEREEEVDLRHILDWLSIELLETNSMFEEVPVCRLLAELW
jgi:hypothetical protein